MGLKQVMAFWMDACVASGSVVKINKYYGLKEWAKPSYSKTLKNRLKWKFLNEYNKKKRETQC